jgi:hypothetical protein
MHNILLKIQILLLVGCIEGSFPLVFEFNSTRCHAHALHVRAVLRDVPLLRQLRRMDERGAFCGLKIGRGHRRAERKSATLSST